MHHDQTLFSGIVIICVPMIYEIQAAALGDLEQAQVRMRSLSARPRRTLFGGLHFRM